MNRFFATEKSTGHESDSLIGPLYFSFFKRTRSFAMQLPFCKEPDTKKISRNYQILIHFSVFNALTLFLLIRPGAQWKLHDARLGER